MGALAALLLSSVMIDAVSAAGLVPSPGTGHGVLTDAPPAEEAASLAYSPGVGGTCAGVQPPETFFTWGYGFGSFERHAVGSPMFVCIGRFSSPDVNLSITPPQGRRIVLPTQTFTENQARIVLAISVLPSPPNTRYRITNDAGMDVSGRLRGSGSGTYRVELSAGATEKTKSFTLESPPTPRLISPNGAFESVASGGRVRFDVAGEKPGAVFRVSVFGPAKSGAANQLRTTLVARANKRGEAIIALDIQTSDSGVACALLEPYTYAPKGAGLDPHIHCFAVNPTTTSGKATAHQYAVTDDVNIRTEPTSTSASVAVVPSGSQVTVECVTTGEQITGPYGPTDKWDRITWNSTKGYVTDEYVESGDDVDDPSIIPAC